MAAALLPILLGISAASAVGGTIAAFDKPKAPTPPSQTTLNAQQAEAATAAAEAQATALQKRRGMASTELTSPIGAGASQTQHATLGA